MKNKKILVAYNLPKKIKSRSDAISEESVIDEANAVVEALCSRDWEAKLFSVKQPADKISVLVKKEKPAAIFNLCEGFDGNPNLEMNIAALWEILNIPYTGCNSKTLAIAQNKITAKLLMSASGIPTPDFQSFDGIPSTSALGFPLIVKAPNEDGSIGISAKSVVYNLKNLKKAVGITMAKYGSPVIAEKYIDGREFHVAIIGTEKIKALPPSETDFSRLSPEIPRITTYSAKWHSKSGIFRNTPSICPAPISGVLRSNLVRTAADVYKLFGAKGYGRVDFRCDSKGKIHVLEFNPNPDISPGAGFSKALSAAGINFADFVEEQIRICLNLKL